MNIDCIEIRNFRRLSAVRVELTPKTTLLVGANNSGKTSAMSCLRMFLIDKNKDKSKFGINDIPLSCWEKIDAAGTLIESGKNFKDLNFQWCDVLPSIDVWINVKASELYRVAHLLPNLNWKDDESIGVRLQLEPVSAEKMHISFHEARQSAKETLKIAQQDWVKKQALKETQNLNDSPEVKKDNAVQPEFKVNLWPSTLCEFLARKFSSQFVVRSYILDSKGKRDPVHGIARPQPLPANSLPLEKDPFEGLIQINEIDAQRGFTDQYPSGKGDESGGQHRQKLSEQLRSYYHKHLDPTDRPEPSDVDALEAIYNAQLKFDERLKAGFSRPISELETLGYTGFNNPRIHLSTRINPTDGLTHDSAVRYGISSINDKNKSETSYWLPEKSNGLGYQNLISMVFKLIAFRDAWMQEGKAKKDLVDVAKSDKPSAPIHLVLVEEPEAHLHAQVQQIFINKAYTVLSNHDLLKNSEYFTTQLVVSTHSSHIAHESDFASMRYFRRQPASNKLESTPTSVVVNLTEIFGDANETAAFVTRYLKTTHCDLFFADGAILVEGAAERILIPHFIKEHFPNLDSRYLTLLEIGGRHAHTLKPLIEHLGINTLLIADIDVASGEGRHKKAVPKRNANLISGNPILKKWIPNENNFDKLLSISKEEKEQSINDLASVRVAYQTPIKIQSFENDGELGEALASTFEDALVLTNIEFFKTLEGDELIQDFREAILNSSTSEQLILKLFEVLSSTNKKAELALDLLMSNKLDQLKVPDYILDGLGWLLDQLIHTSNDSEEIKIGGT